MQMFKVEWSELEGRYDPFYYHPEFKELEEDLERIKFPKKTIKEIAESIFQGRTQGHKETMGLPVLKVKNITQNGFINFYDVEDFDTEHNKTILKYGDILLPFRGQAILLNKVAIFKKEIEQYLHDNNLGVIRLLKSKDINPMFVTVFLQSSFGFRQIRRILGGGTGVLVITKETIGTIKIPIPPRPIQDRVAEIMEEAYKQRKEMLKEAEDLLVGINDFVLDKLGIEIPEVEEKKTFVATLKELKEGKRHDAFYYLPKYTAASSALENSECETKPLKDIIKLLAETRDPTKTPEKPFVYVEISDVDTKLGEITLYKELNGKEAPSRARMVIRKGDIVVSTTRPYRGAIAIVPGRLDDSIGSTGFAVLRPKEEINSLYLHTILRSKLCLAQLEQRMTGSNYPAITMGELKKIKIAVPPIEIQNEIAEEIKGRRALAKEMRKEAEEVIKLAKEKVEKMILGEEND